MKMAVPDLISNSYFSAIAAVELAFFREEGLDMALQHVFPVDKCCKLMRDGEFAQCRFWVKTLRQPRSLATSEPWGQSRH